MSKYPIISCCATCWFFGNDSKTPCMRKEIVELEKKGVDVSEYHEDNNCPYYKNLR
jgi:hypothetical protein